MKFATDTSFAPLAHEDLTLFVPELPAAGSTGALNLFVLASLFAIGCGVALWARHRSRRRVVAEIQGTNAMEIALAELTDWHGQLAATDPRAAITAASGTVRRFLAAISRLPAAAMTTEELAIIVPTKLRWSDHMVWADFAGRCDWIKFAGVRPEPSELDQLFDLARYFVRTCGAKRETQ